MNSLKPVPIILLTLLYSCYSTTYMFCETSTENRKQLPNYKLVKPLVQTRKIKFIITRLLSRKEVYLAILVAAILVAKNLLPDAKARDIGDIPDA